MRHNDLRMLLFAAALLGMARVAAAQITTQPGGGFTMEDPTGDDNGPGTYIYPTDAVYKAGSFDITEFQVVPSGNTVEFRVKVNARIEDPWDSKAWGGNGFSVQMAFIHIDTDHKPGSGVTQGLPGTNVRFAPDDAWDRVVIISPQGPTRVNSEIELKAPQWKDRIVVPRITRASGRTLTAVVDVAALGGPPQESWGYQVLMQSNEGFPDKTDLLTRKVNESEGQHRFGGGSDYDNDPHVIDLLAPPPGDPAQVQHDMLSKYKKEGSETINPDDWAVVRMVYPFAKPVAEGAPAGTTEGPPEGGAAAPARAAGGGGGGGGTGLSISAKTYTKFMYQNDNTQGCLSLSNPFWVDNIGGHNGVCTEFELNVKGQLGKSVTVGARLQSRWGSLWQDWWENGDLKPEIRLSGDTSGESLGMNHAQYIKLRGVWARFAAPIPTVRWITVGSSDYSMWNEWTIGKARYIDRDNGSGVFIEGDALEKKKLSYTLGAMALPKLWAGPGWQTGLPANDPLATLYGTDWAFAAKFESQPMDDLRLRAIGSWLQDWEPDRYSPFLTGPPDAARGADHSVAMVTRFRGFNATGDFVYSPGKLEWLTLSGLLAVSSNYVNPLYATNLVTNGQGFSPVLFTVDDDGNPVSANGIAGTLRAELSDPLELGLSFKAEYFNIGSEYNAVMGSRRESDVLLTDGIITSGFVRGGQLPTLNIANEFVDWDEPWYENCIGWHGATGIAEWLKGSFRAMAEYTFVGYNTDMQNRDTRTQYPDFLYTNGFTDTYGYTADQDYANKYDRGKDPRSVYALFQDRTTHIAVLSAEYPLPAVLPFSPVLSAKYKFVYDRDDRKSDNPNDNYVGKSHLAFVSLALQPTAELKTTFGYEYTHWDEAARNGTQAGGFYDSETARHAFRAGLSYAFGGVLFTYNLEYFHKDLFRDPRAYYDMVWNVWRAKGTFEVAF